MTLLERNFQGEALRRISPLKGILIRAAILAVVITVGMNVGAQVPTWQALLVADTGDTPADLECFGSARERKTVAIDASGHSIVIGCAISGTGWSFLAVKYRPDGSIMWTSQRYGSAVPVVGRAVAVDQAGDVFVTGHRWAGSNNRDIVTAKYAGATGDLIWGKRFDGVEANDDSFDIALDSQGNVVVSGLTTLSDGLADRLVMKVAGADGERLWSVQRAGTGRSLVIVDADDNVIVAGQERGNAETTTAKLDGETGDMLWLSHYSSDSHSSNYAASLAVDSLGDVVIAAVSYGSDLNHDYAVLKYDGVSGIERWRALEAGPEGYPRAAPAIVIDADDHVVLSGSVGPRDDTDMLIQKYDAVSGSQLWSRRYDGRGAGWDEAEAVALDPDSNVLFIGSSTGTDGTTEFLTVKLAGSTGAELWLSHYRSTADAGDFPLSLAVDSTGDPVVVGSSRYLTGSRADFAVVKLNGSDGSQRWAATEGPLDRSQTFGCAQPWRAARNMAVDSAGNTYVSGCHYNGRNDDILTAKISSSGDVIWSAVYDGGSRDKAVAIALDSTGNVIVTAGSFHPITRGDSLTLKYDGETGNELWTARYTGPTSLGEQYAAGLLVDSNDDVVVAGVTSTLGMGHSIATVKYDGSTGEEIWTNLINRVSAEVSHIVADEANNVFVVGRAGNELTVAKLSGMTGTEIWLTPLGPGGGANLAAIDSLGDLVIAGVYFRPDTGADMVTVKVDGLTGNMLWTADSAGPGTDYETATGVAIDAAGDVVVTGYHSISEQDSVYVTIKYNGTNGEPLWESQYGGSSQGLNVAYDLAITGAGDVLVTGLSRSTCGFSQLTTAKYSGAAGNEIWVLRGLSAVAPGSGIRLVEDGSARVAGTALLDRGLQIGVIRIDEGGVVDLIRRNGFESGVPAPLECPHQN